MVPDIAVGVAIRLFPGRFRPFPVLYLPERQGIRPAQYVNTGVHKMTFLCHSGRPRRFTPNQPYPWDNGMEDLN